MIDLSDLEPTPESEIILKIDFSPKESSPARVFERVAG